ncbi:MAG: Ribonuclease BN, partial [uncultured Solirubrobacteraceae bacterium]
GSARTQGARPRDHHRGDTQADPPGVLRGPRHRLGRGAHLLRRARAVSGAHRHGLDRRPGHRSGHAHQDADRDRRTDQPLRRRGAPGSDRVGQLEQGQVGHLRHRRHRARPQRRLGVRGRVHAGLQPAVRGRRGPRLLQAAPAADRRDARDDPPAGRRGGRRDRHRAAGRSRRQRDRHRLHGRHGVGHREVAGAAGHRRPDDLGALLRRTQREAPGLQVHHRRQRTGRRGLDRRFGPVRVLRRELRLVRQDLRHAGRHHQLPRVVVDHQHRDPPGQRAQRGARAQRAARGGRHACREGTPAARARRAEGEEAPEDRL